MIYTFYSYKGGVGRTMALANVAELLFRAGKRVLMIDWDLEAPGLEHFFFPHEQLSTVRQKRGILDLVMGYKRQMTRKLDLSDPDNLPFEKPSEIAQPIAEDHSGLRAESSGKLWLITAGRRLDEKPEEYASRVLNFDWLDFYTGWQGEAYFDWFRRECKTFADVILIDSRTGVTEMGGVCTYHLADVVALFCAANQQNIQGTLDMVQNFAQADPKKTEAAQRPLLRQRGGRPLKTLVVPSRIDLSENAPERLILENLAPALRMRSSEAQYLMIPYIAAYAAGEHLAVAYGNEHDPMFSPRLIETYERLTNRLEALGEEAREDWKRLTYEPLSQEWDSCSRQLAERRKEKILTLSPDEKTRLERELEALKAQRQAMEHKLTTLRREARYYAR